MWWLPMRPRKGQALARVDCDGKLESAVLVKGYVMPTPQASVAGRAILTSLRGLGLEQ
jgi:hypothetical protein